MEDKALRDFLGLIPRFEQSEDEHLAPYQTFRDYRQIWGMGIFILLTTALLPLIVVTLIYYQLIEMSIDSESMLRTERVTSNARRAVAFFLEERLAALTFTVNEIGYDKLTEQENLAEVLRNLKLGFGGLSDLSVISHTGVQVAYSGPFNLEGKDYSKQQWFLECQQRNAYVSEIFTGYRDAPHIVIAVKSIRTDGNFFILRATLETDRLIQLISSYRTGEHADIFLVNREGVVQTQSLRYGAELQHMRLAVPQYSPRTSAKFASDPDNQPIVIGYAFIQTKIAPTPFILMVVKQKARMMKVWLDLRRSINWFSGISALVILLVVTRTSTYMVNRIYSADREKARTMALAEQNCQLASIGQLAAGVAHEINNPLALINETAGYVKDLFQLKQQYQKDPELLEQIDAILEAVERCGTITRQLLGFARRFDVQTQSIDLKEVINDVLNFHKKEAEYRNITMHVDVPENVPMIESDRGKLQQVLLNLVNNAFQAIDNGCFLDIRAAMDGPAHVRISIRDNGCGISEENLKKVFEPFFTTKKEGKGTGLGLSITYGLVKKLHGDITAESAPGEGTTFVVTLPVRLERES
jgi:signal transduction histidine kinase